MYINKDVLNITKGNTKMIDTEFGRMQIEKVEAGKLKLATGKVIATDPILLYDDQCYSKSVAPGTYTVYIYNGKIEKRKTQAVLAELRFNENIPVKWEMALFEGENSSSFASDEFMGYEVENGLGCFMDEHVMSVLDVLGEDELEKYENNIKDTIRKGDKSWADVIIDEKTGSNIIVFASGWNSGVFPTYYGFDKNNKLVKLVTDFMVIEA
ncbi:hypothetical protein J2Z76_000807 [Sedimentibacter acidaminivorans]|jgi:uncharacterized protein DUF4241|uniref:DUF4241 domain-containing protein n=1 Tax=Sedimentibacter acidaminivorans TaxID=913099 RepID=A0ABS4GB84_9FIRM|nr:DUF4241 domain-containing protein [Sedimentibacter acidaminivorans]MBP1924950.1 hypothetical protein [Sedimentibacter acidaminivorans]